ncbi:MAG: Uma2 family endonuclease [Aggregatilineales bacterium]
MTEKPLEKLYTIDDLLALPDDGKRYELHNGEIVEVGTSSRKHSILALWIGRKLLNFVEGYGFGGDVTGETGTYKLDELNTKVPDAAYVSKAKTETLPRGTVFYPFPPDLAVEIKSPSQSDPEMRVLATLYQRTGVRLIWIIDPEAKIVTVYRTGHLPFEVSGNGELDGYDILPGFKLNLAEMFAKVEDV